MKRFKKLLSLMLTSLTMFVLAMTPAYAAPTVPESTAVTIHKVVGTGGFTLRDHDGRLLTPEEIATLGTNAVENNTGVEFTAWKVLSGAKLEDFANMDDADLTAAYPNPVVVKAGDAYSFGTGTYYVRETKRPATLESQLGVPFIMELPVLNVAGDAYLTALHLYPKNVIEDDMPVIDKDVKVKDNDHAGFDVGYTFDYLIYPKVPQGIEDYTVFKVYDKLNSALDYMGNLTVTYNGVTFDKGADYTLTESAAGTAGGEFTLTFTADGLKKLAANRAESETDKTLEIKFQARINKTAAMGTNIYNNAVLTYNNGYTTDKTVDVPDVNRPEVHTGGRQFIKVDNVTQTYLDLLAEATFVVKNSDGKYMAKDSEGKVTWVADLADATKIDVNDVNGSFEVTGLAYGDTGAAFTYTLEEVVVPEGYVKMADLSFTIDANSYISEAVIKVVNVKRPHIPQTGGIGTIIFLATGLTLMGAAVVALRRKEQSDK